MGRTELDQLARPRRRFWWVRFTTPVLLARFEERKVIAVITAVNGGLVILALSVLSWLTDLPLVFPALGPSSFILFSSPLSIPAAPRNVIMGHVCCLASGWVIWSLVSWLAGVPVSAETGGWPLLCSASLVLAACGLLLVRFSFNHPPACASGLVVAIGAVTGWYELVLMAVAMTWLTYQAVGVNRLVGLPVPLWRPRKQQL